MKKTLTAAAMLAAVPTLAAAQEGAYLPGQPHPWQLGLQEALSPIEEQIHWFSAYTLWLSLIHI